MSCIIQMGVSRDCFECGRTVSLLDDCRQVSTDQHSSALTAEFKPFGSASFATEGIASGIMKDQMPRLYDLLSMAHCHVDQC